MIKGFLTTDSNEPGDSRRRSLYSLIFGATVLAVAATLFLLLTGGVGPAAKVVPELTGADQKAAASGSESAKRGVESLLPAHFANVERSGATDMSALLVERDVADDVLYNGAVSAAHDLGNTYYLLSSAANGNLRLCDRSHQAIEVWGEEFLPVEPTFADSFVELGLDMGRLLRPGIEFSGLYIRTPEDVVLTSFRGIRTWAGSGIGSR